MQLREVPTSGLVLRICSQHPFERVDGRDDLPLLEQKRDELGPAAEVRGTVQNQAGERVDRRLALPTHQLIVSEVECR